MCAIRAQSSTGPAGRRQGLGFLTEVLGRESVQEINILSVQPHYFTA